MPSKQRPVAKNVLDGILQAMHDAQEPLDESLVLVPAHFEVYLHPEAYLELQPLLPRIQAHAEQRLDEELERLNRRRSGGWRSWIQRTVDAIARLLVAERYVQRRAQGRVYERSGPAWTLAFAVTAEPKAVLDYLAVETDFGTARKVAYRGHPTVNIRKRTTMLPNGRFETVLTAPRPKLATTSRSPSGVLPSRDVLARLQYEDNRGAHVYYMKKDQIVIGRRDDQSRPLDIALDTLPDVSREHLRIRYDEARRAFTIQDISQYGVTVNGSKIPPNQQATEPSEATWHPLPGSAEIGLANAVFIHFEALPS